MVRNERRPVGFLEGCMGVVEVVMFFSSAAEWLKLMVTVPQQNRQ